MPCMCFVSAFSSKHYFHGCIIVESVWLQIYSKVWAVLISFGLGCMKCVTVKFSFLWKDHDDTTMWPSHLQSFTAFILCALWLELILQGNAGVKRASYEAKWHIFSTASSKISKKDVPLLTSTPDEARAIMLHGTSGRSEIKQRVKLELMKWHPDKFQGRFGNRLSTEHRDEILEYVKRMSQMLNDLLRTA